MLSVLTLKGMYVCGKWNGGPSGGAWRWWGCKSKSVFSHIVADLALRLVLLQVSAVICMGGTFD